MKTPKFIILLLILGFITNLYASKEDAIYGELVSYECPDVSGIVTINIQCEVKRQVHFISNPVITLPTGWNYQMVTDKTGQTFNKGETPIISFKITYNPDSLPFYPVTIRFTQNVMVDNDVNNIQNVFAEGKIYFTPYNIVEVWSNADFYNIPRMWLDKASNIDTTRIYVSKSSIPATNLTEADSIVYEWQEDWTFREVPGLAYYIPMKAMHPDSIEWYAQNVGDGPDASPEPKATYNGRVKGRLYTYIKNDIGQWVKVYLKGIRVKLIEKDLACYETFAEGYTDDNGYFDLEYSKWQTLETGKIELYLQFKSKTKDVSDYKIKCKQNNIWQNIYEEKIYLGQYQKDAPDILLGDVERNHDAFRVVHWARNGMRYLRTAYSGFMGKLEIHIFRNGSYFFADGIFGISAPLVDPSIYLEDEDGDHENTIYHEFGHYSMWEMQGRNWIAMWCKTGDCSHSWSTENTSRLAWCEGWANAMQMILDAHWRNEDEEYAYNENSFFNNRGPYYETRIDWGTNNINRGIWSEYYIACAIYDLWDGAGKGLSGNIPGTSPPIHAYNDNNNWNTGDDIELSFSQIIQPILIHSGIFGKIHHIGEYYKSLLDEVIGTSNCVLRSNISRCFRENMVLYDININVNKRGNTCLSSDDIFLTKKENIYGELGPLEINSYSIGPVSTTYSDVYKINLYGSARTTNKDILFYPFVIRYITDDLILGNNTPLPTTVNLNFNTYYYYNDVAGVMYTCNGADIILNNGTITLGDPIYIPPVTSANLEINDLSLLQLGSNGNLKINSFSNIKIKAGGSIYIQNGAEVLLKNNSRIIVEPGGYICIEDGAVINLEGTNSIIELQPGALLGVNPVLNISPTNCVSPGDIQIVGNGQIIYVCEDFAEYTHLNEVNIVSSSNPFDNNTYKFKENLIIENNAVLTINNAELQFAKDKKIIIQPGSKLILNNTKVTNLEECGNFWQGIEVWGNRLASQHTPGAQGIVELKNGAVIENARQAIRAIKMNDDGTLDWNKTGGIVRANGAIFRNNIKGVWFGAYDNYHPISGNPAPNLSYFKNCTFETNDNFIDINSHPHEFVGLVGVKGIRFSKNTFINTNISFSGSRKGYGIVSFDSDFSVVHTCVSPVMPCTQYEPNVFENLYYGIFADNTNSNYTLEITGNEFNNNFRAVALKNVNHAKIVSNNFNVGASLPAFEYKMGGSGQIVPVIDYSYGLSLENCSGYRVEENEFGSNHSNAGFGVIVQNSGTAPNQIYNNTFENLSFAVRAQGNNGGSFASLKSGGTSMPVYLSSGLVVKCNDFSNINVADISVTSGSIAPNQNYCSNDTKTPANNLFSDTTSGNFPYNIFINPLAGNIKYSVNPNAKTNPVNYTVNKVDIGSCANTLYNESASCPSYLLPDLHSVINLKAYYSTNTAYAESLSSLFDGGNTQTLLDNIYQNKPAGELKNTLIAASPYLSDTVLLATVKHKPSPLPPGILKEILVPNSPLSPNVMQAVVGRTPSLPGGIMNEINAVQYGISERELLEKELAYLEGEIAMFEKMLIQTWLADTTYNGRDSVIAWFESKPQTTETQQYLVEAYVANAQLTEAMQMLSQLTQTTANDSAFVAYYTILTELYLAGENIFSLTPAQEQTIRQIAESETSVSGNAQAVLSLVYGDEYELIIEELLLPDSMSIYGYLSSGAFCDYMPVAGDTLFLVDENMEPVAVMPYAVTNNDGYFIFNTHHFIFADTTKLYGISTKSAFQIDDVVFAPLHQLISSSPHELIHGDVRLDWFDLYAGPDSIYAIGTKVDLNGNIYVGGRTFQLNPLGNNVFLVKYSPQGERLWETVYDAGVTHLHEYLFDLETDSNGNSYMLFYSATTNDILLKFDDKGQLIWTAAVENIPNKKFRGINIEFDIYGNIIVAGHLDDYSQQTANTDFFVAKFNENGQKIWFQLFDMSQNDNLMSMTTDKDGNIIISGSYYANSIKNGIVICYDNNGTLLWSNTYITGGSDIASVVKTDLAGNVYVAGNTDYEYGFLLKYSSNGNLMWTDNNFSHLIPRALIIDSENMLYVGMEKWTSIYENISYSARKYNENGNMLWQSTYENPDFYAARFNSVAIDNNNYIYASGYAMTDDSTENSVAVTVKMDSDGNFIRTDIFSVPNGIKHQGNNLVVSENNNIYVAGQCYDAEAIKMFTVKYSQCHSQSGLRSDQWYPDEENDNEAEVLPELSNHSLLVYPNPYSGQTTIELNLDEASAVRAEIYTILGQKVCSLHEGNLQQGTHSFIFSAYSHGFSAGVYILKLFINNESMHRMLIEME